MLIKSRKYAVCRAAITLILKATPVSLAVASLAHADEQRDVFNDSQAPSRAVVDALRDASSFPARLRMGDEPTDDWPMNELALYQPNIDRHAYKAGDCNLEDATGLPPSLNSGITHFKLVQHDDHYLKAKIRVTLVRN